MTTRRHFETFTHRHTSRHRHTNRHTLLLSQQPSVFALHLFTFVEARQKPVNEHVSKLKAPGATAATCAPQAKGANKGANKGRETQRSRGADYQAFWKGKEEQKKKEGEQL